MQYYKELDDYEIDYYRDKYLNIANNQAKRIFKQKYPFLTSKFDYNKDCSDNIIPINDIDVVEVNFYSHFIKINLDFNTNRGPPTVV